MIILTPIPSCRRAGSRMNQAKDKHTYNELIQAP